MKTSTVSFAAIALGYVALGACARQEPAAPSPQDVIARSASSDWRDLDPENVLYMELTSGRVVIELAPQFAPIHVANIKTLVRHHYFDNLSVMRAQDNYVVQWGDPDHKRDNAYIPATAAPEFLRPLQTAAAFRKLQDPDTYASQVGFVDSWPVARDPSTNKEWLTHCYAMVGVGRDTAPDSGNGVELYAVIGHSPRHLDRNVALVGRVVQGIELLSSLPRGTGAMGFYEKPEQNAPIKSVTVAADVPAAQRQNFEALRSDTPLFGDYLTALRSRRVEWFVEPTNRLEICNARVPVRVKH